MSKKTLEQEYFALFNCDEWKGSSSMRLIGVFTSEGLNKQLSKLIKDGDMDFDYETYNTHSELSIEELNIAITYGYIERLSIDEVL